MKNLALITICTLTLVAACSNSPLEVNEDQIQSSVAEGKLNILNKSDQTIYYFIVDSEILPVIYWAPESTEENKLPGFNSKSFAINEILTGDKESGTAVFFYWQKVESINTEDIKSIGIQIE